MIHVSSSFTLFLKIVVPTVWLVFFGVLTIAFFTQDVDAVGGIPADRFKYILLGFFLGGLFLLLLTLIRLKRVDMNTEHMAVTNYFKSYQYPYSSIEKIEESDYLLFRIIHIYLRKKGKFGKKIKFMASRKRFHEFMALHPEIFSQFIQK